MIMNKYLIAFIEYILAFVVLIILYRWVGFEWTVLLYLLDLFMRGKGKDYE